MAKNHIIPLFIPHAGCTSACIYCNQKSISGEAAPVTAEKAARCIEAAFQKTKHAEIAFYGGNFTALDKKEQAALLDAAKPFINKGQVSGIRLSTKPDCIDHDALRFLKARHVKTIELGAQSMDDEVLRLSGRGHTADDTRRAAALIKEYGFSLVLQLMCGLPGDDILKARHTATEIAALKPDGIRIYPVVVLKDTRLFALYQAGNYTPLSLEAAVDLCADMAECFERHDIPILRVGLQTSNELLTSVAAGPYHPAFGEMVKSRVLYRKILASIQAASPEKSAVIAVSQECFSAAIGQKRENMVKLKQTFPGLDIRMKNDMDLRGNALSFAFDCEKSQKGS